jgi:hypothetical protein
VAANKLHSGPPSDTPIKTARRLPAASMTARTSSRPRVERGQFADGHRIRQAGAALVEQDQASHGAEASQKARERRLVPEVFEV